MDATQRKPIEDKLGPEVMAKIEMIERAMPETDKYPYIVFCPICAGATFVTMKLEHIVWHLQLDPSILDDFSEIIQEVEKQTGDTNADS